MTDIAIWPILIGVALGAIALINLPTEPMFDMKGDLAPTASNEKQKDDKKKDSLPKPTSMKKLAKEKDSKAKVEKSKESKEKPLSKTPPS